MGGGNLRLVRAQVLCTSVVAISALTSGVRRTRLLPSPFPARFKWPGGGICRHALRRHRNVQHLDRLLRVVLCQRVGAFAVPSSFL